MNHYVYEITNLINGKKYIGKRSCKCDIKDDKYMGSGIALKNAFNKYGLENFKKDILVICESEEISYKEEEGIICERNAYRSELYYNLNTGGKGGMKGRVIPEEEKARRSLSMKGRIVPEYVRKLAYESNMGKRCSDETRLKISESRKGQRPSEENIRKLAEFNKGNKYNLGKKIIK